MSLKLRQRSEIAEEYKWNPADVFADDEAWEEALGEVEEQERQLAAYRNRLSEGPETLLACLRRREDAARLAAKINIYAAMFYSVDTADQEAVAKQDRARSTFGRLAAAGAFLEPELIQIGFDTLAEWMQQDDALKVYAHYFDQLQRLQKHVRSAEVEQVLGLVRDAFGTAANTHAVLANAELPIDPVPTSDGDTIEIGQGNYGALISDPDRDIRRAAYEHYTDAHLRFKNTMANNLAAGVKQDVFFMRVQGYSSSLEASLYPRHIPVEVFHNTIATFRKHLGTWHRYWRVRRHALGYDALHPYDVKAPLTRDKLEISYDQAVEWVSEGMKPLGEEYVSVMRRGLLEERWIDVYPSKGKRAGAFSMGSPGTHPYIMLNHNDDVFGLSTLAHELGHSMHSYYSWKNQPLVYGRYGLFLAEVASNFNQVLTRAHLLDNSADPQFQIAIIEEAMSNFHRYFFIMPLLAQFELAIHDRVEKGGALTADYLTGLMAELFAEGYGNELQFEREREGITWAAFHTHLYYNFYVYQYTTGIAAAHALGARVSAGDGTAVDAYLDFLKSGGSRYPLETLQAAGADMSSPEPLETTFAILSDYVDRLERLLGGKS
jgi:oligoendopeptidase F